MHCSAVISHTILSVFLLQQASFACSGNGLKENILMRGWFTSTGILHYWRSDIEKFGAQIELFM